ncbi:cytochrome P450 [Fulvivirga lutea]|uniref:Cytochrome P450 n=1 Tax=Fulvivirga lutea TaxID=2810512 RepID=A0A974ZZK2_9BACT|nr:cytochrome P450 [Fulvivirga lutea]QSE96216.1 cytochrome P450 [Fulvivirga lutea]
MNLWRPLDTDNINNPYPMYEEIRNAGGIYKAQTGEIIVTNYKSVEAILKDKENFKVGNGKEWIERGVEYFKTKDTDLTSITDAIDKFILLINPPEHQEIRKFISEVWNEREVENIILANCNELIDSIKDKSEFDLIEDFASHLPAMTISRIMGIESDSYKELQGHGEKMIKALDFYLKFEDLLKIEESARAFINYFKKVINKPPASGLISKLTSANSARNKPLSEKQLISICIFLFVAGEETTVSFISTSVYNLIRTNQWKTLKGEDVENVIDELLRFDGPVQLLGRIASSDVELNGTTISKGSTVTLCLAAANRDPDQFKNPTVLDLTRKPRHLAFGTGNHFCLGDWLARKQAGIALSMLIKNFPTLHLSNNKFTWRKQLAIRRLELLPVLIK